MSPEESHWRMQISAKPDDLTLRLVFADWLQERNGPGDGYVAAWIRHSINDRTDFAEGDHPDPATIGMLLSFRFGLLDITYDKVKSLQPISDWRFKNGFVESVVIEPEPFMFFAEKLFSRQPLRSVTLHSVRPLNGWHVYSSLDADPDTDYLWNRLDEGDFEDGVLPTDLWHLLDGHDRGDKDYKLYTSEDAARDALSRACVKYGLNAARITRE